MDAKITNKPAYGPHNPHPLSQLRTELVWEGKYDEYGNRREVDTAALAMPLQKIETIDQPRSEAAAAGQLDMFEKQSPRRDDFRNRLAAWMGTAAPSVLNRALTSHMDVEARVAPRSGTRGAS